MVVLSISILPSTNSAIYDDQILYYRVKCFETCKICQKYETMGKLKKIKHFIISSNTDAYLSLSKYISKILSIFLSVGYLVLFVTPAHISPFQPDYKLSQEVACISLMSFSICSTVLVTEYTLNKSPFKD